jgi:hypothetical protein
MVALPNSTCFGLLEPALRSSCFEPTTRFKRIGKNMPIHSSLAQPHKGFGILRTGLFIGLAGGLAEIAVVWLYSALTGGDAARVARQVASATGLEGASAITGVAIHMGLAVAVGIVLSAGVQRFVDRPARDGVTISIMVGSLGVIWVVNYLVLLPVLSPSFTHLLPYTVTFASKLMFGFAAAATLKMLPTAAPLLS